MLKSTIGQNGHVRQVISRNPANGRVLGAVKRTPEQCVTDFWARVHRPKSGCWEWQGGKKSKIKGRDYGVVWMRGKKRNAHKIAWEYSNGPVPDGLFVLHSCDNPPCCNPEHLFLGTHLDNVKDCISKGRGNREKGQDRYNAKLSEKDILEIRERYKPRDKTDSGRALANQFKVRTSMISAIINRRRWKHIPPN